MSIQEKLTKIAEDMPKVYDAGIAEGRNAEWSDFWDDFQLNGERRNYYYAFFSRWNLGTWSNKTFKPKYPIVADGGANATADTDVCRNMLYGCYGITEIKQAIVLRNTRLHSTFADVYYLKAIHDLTLENITYAHQPFAQCPTLVSLNIKGEIAVNGFSWAECIKLDRDSIVKIIGILSTTTTGLTVTLSATAVNNAFATDGTGSTSAEWLALVATRSNWTIALA